MKAKPMKIWILQEHSKDDIGVYIIVGVYDSLEKAEEEKLKEAKSGAKFRLYYTITASEVQ